MTHLKMVSCCIDFWFRAPASVIVKACVCVHDKKAHGEVQVWLDLLASVLDGSEWLPSRSGRFILGAKASGYCWIGCRVGSTAGMNIVMEKKMSCPCREMNHDSPVVRPVA